MLSAKETLETGSTDIRDMRHEIKILSRPQTPISVYHFAEVWAVIVAAIATSVVLVPLSTGIAGLFVYVAMLSVIASRQHALMVLTHEGIHKRISRTLWVNDWLSQYRSARFLPSIKVTGMLLASPRRPGGGPTGLAHLSRTRLPKEWH